MEEIKKLSDEKNLKAWQIENLLGIKKNTISNILKKMKFDPAFLTAKREKDHKRNYLEE